MARKTAARLRSIGVGQVNLTQVRCAYCQGQGKDPFRLLSKLANCGVCRGTGVVEVEAPYHPCAFCSATGIHPQSRLTCTACKGKGVIPVREPIETCPVCGGKGRDSRGDLELYCTTCGGAGVVPDLAHHGRGK